MTDERITAITMPKWGLSMSEGTVMEWLAEEGVEIVFHKAALKSGTPRRDGGREGRIE